MAKNLKVGNTTYSYPTQGQDPAWGQPASDWAEAITNVVATLSGASDINLSEGNINNNQVVAIPITATKGKNLQFNDTTVIAAEITYLVQRTVGAATIRQFGKFMLVKDNGIWNVLETSTSGDSGIIFAVAVVSGLAKITYTSTNLTPGTGKIYYSAKAITNV